MRINVFEKMFCEIYFLVLFVLPSFPASETIWTSDTPVINLPTPEVVVGTLILCYDHYKWCIEKKLCNKIRNFLLQYWVLDQARTQGGLFYGAMRLLFSNFTLLFSFHLKSPLPPTLLDKKLKFYAVCIIWHVFLQPP